MPPCLDELMADFLTRRQAECGLGVENLPANELEAFEAVPAQSVDPRQAWDAATELLATKFNRLPAGWTGLVANLESMTGLPMAIGNFPQAIRDLLPLIRATSLAKTLNNDGAINDDPALVASISAAANSSEPAKWLLAAAMLRLARRFDEAQQLLNAKQPLAPTDMQAAFANERAALAWHRGDRHAAAKLWAALPDSTTSLFNRGMSELFADRPQAALPLLQSAVAALSDQSPWHHLGRLYCALAESK